MNVWLLVKSCVGSLIFAVGQVFAWLNRRESKREHAEKNERVEQLQSASAKPSREHADRINRWLLRGRSGRLRPPP
ncbi:MAG: hypothetical protein ACKVT0_06640 [Planctomycetaceae bacterium]